MEKRELKVEVNGKKPKATLAAADDGRGTGVSCDGTMLDLVRLYGEMSVVLNHNIACAVSKAGEDASMAGNLMQAAIMAALTTSKFEDECDFTHFFGPDSAVGYTLAVSTDDNGADVSLQGSAPEICAALTTAVKACKERLEGEVGPALTKFFLQKAWLIGAGFIDEDGERVDD